MSTSIKISKKVFNPTYLPYLTDYEKRTEVYYGGAGSGKSHFIAQKLIYKGLTSKRKILIIRKVGNSLRDSVFSMFKSVLSDKTRVVALTFTKLVLRTFIKLSLIKFL